MYSQRNPHEEAERPFKQARIASALPFSSLAASSMLLNSTTANVFLFIPLTGLQPLGFDNPVLYA